MFHLEILFERLASELAHTGLNRNRETRPPGRSSGRLRSSEILWPRARLFHRQSKIFLMAQTLNARYTEPTCTHSRPIPKWFLYRGQNFIHIAYGTEKVADYILRKNHELSPERFETLAEARAGQVTWEERLGFPQRSGPVRGSPVGFLKSATVEESDLGLISACGSISFV